MAQRGDGTGAGGSGNNAVVIGLVALLGVGLVVGLLVSGVALGATRVLGLGGDSGGGGTGTTATAQESMVLPEPVPTAPETGPLLTLAPAPSPEGLTTGGPVAPPSSTEAASGITLQAGTTQAGPGEEVTLSGVYPGGEGATLSVERLTGDAWVSFADLTATVRGETFSTYIRTSQTGESRFRMRDVATDVVSNEVVFTIG